MEKQVGISRVLRILRWKIEKILDSGGLVENLRKMGVRSWFSRISSSRDSENDQNLYFRWVNQVLVRFGQNFLAKLGFSAIPVSLRGFWRVWASEDVSESWRGFWRVWVSEDVPDSWRFWNWQNWLDRIRLKNFSKNSKKLVFKQSEGCSNSYDLLQADFPKIANYSHKNEFSAENLWFRVKM